MALLEIKNLNFTYNGATEAALEGVDLSVESGDIILLCGESGCGKTTLLKLLKRQLRPSGELSGSIIYRGAELDLLDERTSVSEIGYVMQNPDNQSVTDSVWHELAFGLESLGESSDVIRRRVAEICGFFGIGDIYRKKIYELSGGQRQLLSLASVMVMNPSLLLLDEPTSQLDPIAASQFLSALKKINEELGVTVIIAEHRLEEIMPMATKVVLMDKARVISCDTPRNVGKALTDVKNSHKMALGMPVSVRLYHALGGVGDCPLTVREGKRYVEKSYKCDVKALGYEKTSYEGRNIALEMSGGYFRYERALPDVLSGVDLKIFENEIFCILGANGSGKTTLLRTLSGVRKLYRGSYKIFGKKLKEYSAETLYRENIASLPQNPQNLFVKNTVYEDLSEAALMMNKDKKKSAEAVDEVARELEISHLYAQHPYDLSGGEQQKAALAKVLLMRPRVLLLDEPTKGLDAYSKSTLAGVIARLKEQGKTIVIVTHDVEFAAEHADRCAMFFDGEIVSSADTVEFFASNKYYTTAAARITRPSYTDAVTLERAVELCKINGRRGDNGEK